MALPPNDQELFVVSSRGAEQESSGIFVKSSWWSINLRFNTLSLVNYDGNTFLSFRKNVEEFHLSQALDSGYSINSDLIWLWEVTSTNELRLVEIEPFENSIPIINSVTSIDTGVVNVRTHIIDGYYPRVMILKTGIPNTLWFNIYSDVKTGTPVFNNQLEWESTRYNNFDFDDFTADYYTIDQIYSNQSSPGNIYTLDTSFSVPQFVSITQIGGLKTIGLEWDTITGAEDYTLERSTDPIFDPGSTIEAYSGSDTTYIDTVPSYDITYYYRVKMVMTSALLESAWSGTESITPTAGLIASFTGDPLSGNANLAVQFTDTSLGLPTSWDWDFGDGYTSTEQNPIHVYETAGIYSVTLEVHNSLADNSHIEIDYITVNLTCNFYAINRIGSANLAVSFYDASIGNPDTWDWDFGDGSTHSTEQNPTHTYTSPGFYTVVLTSSIGSFSDVETKVNYVTVYTSADFEGDPRKGASTLNVQFHDLTRGDPVTWYWSFGDGTYSNEQNPSHYYTRPGTYTVSLTAASTFNGDTETKVSYIVISGVATLDIAPEPDLTMYLFNAGATTSKVGIKVRYKTQS
jgi:PKD repeat protein